jgi:hypothetical protein
VTITPEIQTHDDPRIGGVDAYTWRAIPHPDNKTSARTSGWCVVAGDLDEADVWVDVTAEYPKDVAEFIAQAVIGEHSRLTNPRPPQTRPAVAINQATRILGTDADDIARLVRAGRLTEMYTRPTFGLPEAIYNATELQAIAELRRAEAEIDRLRGERDGVPPEIVAICEQNERLHGKGNA